LPLHFSKHLSLLRHLFYSSIGLLVVGSVSTLVLSGCGGGGGGSSAPSPSPTPSPIVQVSIQPTAITLSPAAQSLFVGTVTNTSNSAVLWSVGEGASGGTVNQEGRYTAPALAGGYHVIARSAVDPSQLATATVTVPIVVTVSPAEATTVSQAIQFNSSVNVAQNGTVTWKVLEGDSGGAITPNGTYTPPGLGGVFHVIATSKADGSTQGIATVNVQSGGAAGVIQ